MLRLLLHSRQRVPADAGTTGEETAERAQCFRSSGSLAVSLIVLFFHHFPAFLCPASSCFLERATFLESLGLEFDHFQRGPSSECKKEKEKIQ